jgi:Spy/CpxP family protein refolding chaperone
VKTRLTLAVGVLLLATTVFAADLPPGKWWRRPEIIQQLQLTDEQQSRLEAAFRVAADDLIDLRGEVEKTNIALRFELDRPQLDRQKIRSIAAHLSDARGKLFDRELMMLVDMRAVLTETQWNRMRTLLDRLNGGQQQQGGRLPRRRGSS